MNMQASHSDTTAMSVPHQRDPKPGTVGHHPHAVRVMLVDDTADLLRLMRMLFSFHEGVEVCAEAHNGLEALELWRAERPDVVVMDVQMPVMSGLEAAARILAEDPTQQVVLFSAAFRPVDHQLAAAIGVAACSDKRDVADLPALVEGVCARTHLD
jgi:CheY-like chemotaxis protein